MKKYIAVFSAVIVIGCMFLAFCACGAKDEEIVTTTRVTSTTTTSPTETTTKNSGKVTDESRKGENGVIGDIVTDISEGLSEMVTDVSRDMAD
jgi:hypothetical protein